MPKYVPGITVQNGQQLVQEPLVDWDRCWLSSLLTTNDENARLLSRAPTPTVLTERHPQ